MFPTHFFVWLSFYSIATKSSWHTLVSMTPGRFLNLKINKGSNWVTRYRSIHKISLPRPFNNKIALGPNRHSGRRNSLDKLQHIAGKINLIVKKWLYYHFVTNYFLTFRKSFLSSLLRSASLLFLKTAQLPGLPSRHGLLRVCSWRGSAAVHGG